MQWLGGCLSLALNVDFVMPASRSLSGSKQADVANDPERK
jgi:hypothetical protein